LPRNGEVSTTLTFSVPSSIEARNYSITVSAQDSSGRIETALLTVIIQDFVIDVIEDSVYGKVSSMADVTIKIMCQNGYRGTITLSYQGDVKYTEFSTNPVNVDGQDMEVIFSFKIIGPPGEKMVTVTGIDEDGIRRSDTFTVVAQTP